MREILFKAKRIDNGEWVEGFLFKMQMEGGYTWCIGEEPLTANDYSEIIGCGRTWFFINHHTLCQYTGLTDKNGNKIWENDIVKCYAVDICDREYEFVSDIFWDDCMWMVHEKKYSDGMLCHFDMSKNWLSHIPEIEAIGNIFDNPELINRTEF